MDEALHLQLCFLKIHKSIKKKNVFSKVCRNGRGGSFIDPEEELLTTDPVWNYGFYKKSHYLKRRLDTAAGSRWDFSPTARPMNLLPEPAASSSSQALQGETETQPVEDLTCRYPELLSLPSLPTSIPNASNQAISFSPVTPEANPTMIKSS